MERRINMGITDFVKNCLIRRDGQMVCWDRDEGGFVVVELKKTPIPQKDLTDSEIVEIMRKVSK